ncbi:Uncharacterized protein Rs2_06240 [Raphanus sativus]|nr:Uncharacterized protein Rs2_06240 [Raphanus sativus]
MLGVEEELGTGNNVVVELGVEPEAVEAEDPELSPAEENKVEEKERRRRGGAGRRVGGGGSRDEYGDGSRDPVTTAVVEADSSEGKCGGRGNGGKRRGREGREEGGAVR